MKDTPTLVIFQNYFSPYRHKLFTEIAKKVTLTVVYLQKPQEEGREWTEAAFAPTKNYSSLQLENTRPLKVGPFKHVVWVKGLRELKEIVTPKTKVVYLDNLPTNFTMLRIARHLNPIVPRKNRLLWEEHILPKGSDSSIKDLYKKTFTFLLAANVDTVISFSAMTNEYLASLGIPLAGQKIVRTLQATYTQDEIAEFAASAEEKRKKNAPLTFGFLGYMSKRKGLLEFMHAIHYYKNPEARFLFVGTGPLRPALEALAKQDARVKVVPYATTEEEKTAYFTEMTVHVVPSEKDPWCVVVTEAACRGTVSLVSPNVGAKELINKIDKRFLLKNNQGITLAKAFAEVEELLKKKGEAAKLREKTMDIAAKWSVEIAAAAFVQAVE